MSQPPPKHELDHAKAGGAGDKDIDPTASPMGRFKTLTKQLLGVTREQMEREQAIYTATKSSSGKRPS